MELEDHQTVTKAYIKLFELVQHIYTFFIYIIIFRSDSTSIGPYYAQKRRLSKSQGERERAMTHDVTHRFPEEDTRI